MVGIESKVTIYHYYGNLDGDWNVGLREYNLPIGPCLVEIHEVEYVAHRASYFVYINGRHQTGGVLYHGYDHILKHLHCVPFNNYGREF